VKAIKPPVPAYGCEWPPGDAYAEAHVTAGVPFLRDALAWCRQRRRAIQAGGCVGLHPLVLAEVFAAVETFEPDVRNLPFLRRNVAGVRTITLHEGALTDDVTRHWCMKHFDANVGASHLVPYVYDLVPLYRGDDFGWDDVDFVQLDVEGHELPALLGLEQTLLRCRPVVMIEEYGWGAPRYGYAQEEARQWLEARGWKQVAESESDRVLVCASC
jgi:FkbM family methyltransferase